MANNEQVMNELMQSLANQVRVVSGKTELMGIETMANTLNTENSVLNSKLNVQSDLIAQIETALEGKVGGTSIPDGYHDVSEVTASKWDVLEGVKFVNKNGNVITGTIPVRESYDAILDTTITTHTIPAGYHEGDGSVSIVLEEKTVTPTDTQQVITPSEGCVLSKVTVEAASGGGVHVSTYTGTIKNSCPDDYTVYYTDENLNCVSTIAPGFMNTISIIVAAGTIIFPPDATSVTSCTACNKLGIYGNNAVVPTADNFSFSLS